MKNQILMLIIGILIGAIITTGVFLFLKSKDNNKMPSMDRSTNLESKRIQSNSNTTSNNNGRINEE